MDKKLSDKAIKSWIIGRTIALVVLIAIYLGIRFILPMFQIEWVKYVMDNHMIWVNAISFLIIGLTALSAYVEPFFEYKQWSYRINEEEIFFTEGIVFKNLLIKIKCFLLAGLLLKYLIFYMPNRLNEFSHLAYFILFFKSKFKSYKLLLP
ncbi:hypothetical protein [Clostridium sp. B9]|uniref:hypothetical protein n=1 Tax=Clostridium sp. B9 TaxID=3423224 RepID=UPI003D2ED130